MQIEDRTKELQQLFEEEDEEITFGDQVIGEVKKFIVLVLLTALKFYEPCFKQYSGNLAVDQEFLKEKLTQFILKQAFAEGSSIIYKICMSMCRYDTKMEEKKLADEIKRHQHKARPQDFDINPYFLLNDKSPIVEVLESAKKSDSSNRSLNQV